MYTRREQTSRNIIYFIPCKHTNQPKEDLEREGIMAALFDWRAWRLSCLAGSTALQLWFAVVRRAAPNWLDSQLWLLEHNLPWLEQTDAGAQHLAAQLSAALKPFAGLLTYKRLDSISFFFLTGWRDGR